MTADKDALLRVEDLRTSFFTPVGEVKAVGGVSFELRRGEVLGIVGESGSGKSVTMLSLLRLLGTSGRVVGGSIVFDGTELTEVPERRMADLRGRRISMIFQDPMTSLNPVLTIGYQLEEPLRRHGRGTAAERRQRVLEMLRRVGIEPAERRIGQYPHQFSGGQRQRIMIAMALMCHPDLLIADEPTTALDVTVQAQILDLMKELQGQFGTSIVLITHDLQLAARYATRAVVLDEGRLALDIPMTRLFDDEARLAELHLAPTGPPGSQAPAPDPGEPPEPTGEPTLAQGRASLLSRADVRSKLLALAAAVAATLLASDPLANLILAAVTAGAVVTAGGSSVEGGSSGSGADGLRRLRGLLAPLLPVLFLVFAFAVLAPPPGADPDVVARLWPGALPVTAGGLRHAANLVLRLVAMVCGSAAVLASTPTEQFTTLMRTLRLPNALVFMCTTALRFVPTLRQRARQITDAQQVRGARISSGGLVRRIKAHATVMIPLLTSGIRMSEDLAAAMVSRGYGITRHPTRLHDLSWSWRDTLLAAAAIALLAVPLVTG